MRFTYRQPAGPGTVFDRGAFDASIGKDITVNDVDGTPKRGKLIAAEVVEDGAAVLLTIEADADLPTERI